MDSRGSLIAIDQGAWHEPNPHVRRRPSARSLRPGGPLDCSDGQVLHAWCVAGYGIAWRSTWEVESDIAAGRLVTVLDDYAAPPNGIYALFPQRKHLALRVRLWIDFLKHHYGQADFWAGR